VQAVSERYLLEQSEHCNILHLISADGLNRLTRERVLELIEVVGELRQDAARLDSTAKNAPKPLVITGNQHYFSAGADLKEIASLKAVEAFEFSNMGQKLMSLIDDFPTPVYAAISGYCMGGGLDLALALRLSHLRAQRDLWSSWSSAWACNWLGRHTTAPENCRSCLRHAIVCRGRETTRLRSFGYRTRIRNLTRPYCALHRNR